MPVQTMLISSYNPPVKQVTPYGLDIRKCLLAVVSCVVIGTLVGFLLGWLVARRGLLTTGSERASENGEGNAAWARDLDPAMVDVLMTEIKAPRIEHNLKWLTEKNRVAGTAMDLEQAEILKRLWMSYGLDNAGIESYPTLLSYPGNHSDPNRVEVVDAEGQVIFNSRDTEVPVSPYDDPEGATLPYLAYSRPGRVEGDLVYANYGNYSDYEYLQAAYSLNVSGKIVLTRSGGISRFKKVEIAAEYGALGLLIFPDMALNAPDGRSATYPRTWWLPGDATQRGGMYSINGDPLTPGYPAKDYAPIRSEEEISRYVLTPIPVQPVSADGAIALLGYLPEPLPAGPEQWFNWQKGWVDDNQHKRIGGRLKNNRRVRLIVNNRLERRYIHNVFAIIKGAIEPDRLVMIGNHRDAWGKGAVDPGGGTAVMLEISRALGELITKHGWRPRRTIIFASWGAEEFGLVGSTEWVEEKFSILSHKAVAYLNLDVVVLGSGPIIAKASSTLFSTLFQAATKVPHPTYSTLYMAWANQSIGIWPLQPNSDFKPFYYLVGVPSLTVTSANKKTLFPFYPAYHTEYDLFDYVKQHMDPTFEHHQLIGRLHGHMILLLSDSLILPLDVTPGASQIEKEFEYLVGYLSQYYWFQTPQGSQLIEKLGYCVHNFSVDARHMREKVNQIDKSNPFAVRQINDQLMLVERAFVNLRWSQQDKDPIFHHVMQSPGISSCINVNGFPGIKDIFCDEKLKPYFLYDTVPEDVLERVTLEVANLCYALHSATDMLNV